MLKKGIPELVAPADSFAKAQSALDYGADAVYVGLGRLSLRAHAGSFSVEGLGELVDHAHERSRRVYVTLNIMPDDSRCSRIQELLATLAASTVRPDALIISDPGVLKICKRVVPDVALHLSTQTGTFNSESLGFWRDQGISRAVLPRELNLEQIAGLACKQIMPLEVFVHGAMCMSVSGRCLMSAYLQERHPNYGDCPQSCRLQFRVAPVRNDPADESSWLLVEEDGEGATLFNAKDLCTIGILDQIVATGIAAVKIEGRHKSVHYLATVVKAYRAALDRIAAGDTYVMKQEWLQELESIEHRPYTTGFYKGESSLQDPHNVKHSAQVDIAAIVRERLLSGGFVLEVKHPFAIGDVLELLPYDHVRPNLDLRFGRMTDLNGTDIERALPHRLTVVETDAELRPGDIVRRRSCTGPALHSSATPTLPDA